MAIYCSDLLSLVSFRDAKLRAGQNGLTRKITWPFVCVTPTISQWLHGGELLFVTGHGLPKSNSYLLDLTTECISRNLSGIVFLLHPDYIPQIPQDVLEIANSKSFPLFEMPWDVKLVDATKEIIQLMQSENEAKENTRFFLETILFSENYDTDSMLQFYNITLYSQYCLGIVQAEEPSFSQTTEACFRQLNSFFRHSAQKGKNSNILSCPYANQLILLITADKNINELISVIENAYLQTQTFFPSHPLNIALSSTKQDISEIKTAYKEVQLCMSYKNFYLPSLSDPVIKYEKLGIYRILLDLKKNPTIVNYCYQNIEVLVNYDKKHASNLVKTLKTYFLNGESLTKTAAELFIHKNTLAYRMTLIKKLLHTDFSNPLKQMELFISILLYDES